MKNKGHLHSALVANNYFLPSKRAAFCTLKLMMEIFNGQAACPKITDITFRNVVNKPPVNLLVDIVTDAIEKNRHYPNGEVAKQWKRLAVHIRKSFPEKYWLLGLLGLLNQGHAVFEKGYKPPPSREANQLAAPMVPNPDGFFDNLMELPKAELKKGCSISFLSKRERLENQLHRLEER